MASRAERAVVVADSSKIGRATFSHVGGADLFGTVITDAPAPELADAGYEVIVAT